MTAAQAILLHVATLVLGALAWGPEVLRALSIQRLQRTEGTSYYRTVRASRWTAS